MKKYLQPDEKKITFCRVDKKGSASYTVDGKFIIYHGASKNFAI